MADYIPLAEQLRPKTIDEFVGQEHLIGEHKPLRNMIINRRLVSMIFWGPPGCGKTTLAKLIAQAVDADLYFLSAVSAGKKDVKAIVDQSLEKRKYIQKDLIPDDDSKVPASDQ